MKIAQLLVSVLLLVLLVVACAPKAAPAPAPQIPAPAAPAPAAAAPKAPVKAAWEVEWEKTLEAAKKEREVVVFTSDAVYRTELVPLFKEKYGITLEFLVAKGQAVASRLLPERRAGIFSYDAYLGGGTTALTVVKPAGALDPLEPALILPEVTDPKVWYGNRLPWLDRDRTIFESELRVQAALAINTNLVKPEELKSYRDVLDPRWKGKILLVEPFGTGAGSKTLGVIANNIMGWDYLHELKRNQPVPVKDVVQARDWLAFGKAAIAFGPKSSTFIEAIRVGVPISLYNPQEGSYLTAAGAATMINRAPHPNAVKVFINWLLSREGQMATTRASGEQSAREDIPIDFLHPLVVRKPGVKYIYAGGEEFNLEQPNVIKKLEDIFGAK